MWLRRFREASWEVGGGRAGAWWENHLTPHESHNTRETAVQEGKNGRIRVFEQSNAPDFQISSCGGSKGILMVVRSKIKQLCAGRSRKSLASGCAHPGLPQLPYHCIGLLFNYSHQRMTFYWYFTIKNN